MWTRLEVNPTTSWLSPHISVLPSDCIKFTVARDGNVLSVGDFTLALLESPITVTIALDEPEIKPSFLASLISQLLRMETQVHFIDLDLQFSSLVESLRKDTFRNYLGKRLSVYRPEEARVPSDIVEAAVSFSDRKGEEQGGGGGVVVVDSINTLQNLLYDPKRKRGRLEADLSFEARLVNQKAAILITIVQSLAKFYSKSVLLLNLTKQRPKTELGRSVKEEEGEDDDDDSSVLWERELVGGRIIRYKSDAILTAKLSFERKVGEIGASPKITLESFGQEPHLFAGKRFIFEPEEMLF